MTLRLSTGTRNGLVGGLGFAGMFNRGYGEIYTGAQPASADALKTGTLLGVISAASLPLTKETPAAGTLTLATGAAGSINTVTVGGLNIIPDGTVPYNTSLAQTASDLADAINRNGIMQASVSGATVTLTGRPGTGVTTAAVAFTATTLTATAIAMGTAVAGIAPVNGLLMAPTLAGVIARLSTQIWSFNGVAAGTAGWFRLYGSNGADTGALLTGAPWYPRLDGSIAVSGGDMGLSNIAVGVGAPNTIDRFNVTQPSNA